MTVHLNRGSIDFVVEDMDLRQALGELFLLMGAKFELPPEVQGRVTARLHQVTYQQALEFLLGSEFTYSIGPHDVIYVHKGGTSWKPGNEKVA